MTDMESQIVELLAKNAEGINALEDKWIAETAAIAEKYYKLEENENVRCKVVDSIRQIFNKYHAIYGEELVNKVILPNFSDVDQETSSPLRRSLIHLLSDLASNCISYKHCNAILAILRRMLTRPFRHRSEELANGIVYIFSNRELVDSRSIVSNLNRLFVVKLHLLPIDPAVNILDILVSYLNLTFKHPLQGPTPAELPLIRKEVLSRLLNLRCNKYGHLGVIGPNQSMNDVTYSPFIVCVKRPASPNAAGHFQAPLSPGVENQVQMNFSISSTSHQPPTVGAQQTHSNPLSSLNQQHSHNIFLPNALYPNCPIESRCVDLDPVFNGLIECLIQETDVETLETVLRGLPGLLANKPLVSTAGDERINQLCIALCNLITTNRNANNRQAVKTDYVKHGLRCLTSLLIYRRLLDYKSIKMMLSVFEDSIRAVSRHPIVPLFTTCLIELRDSSEMTKFVPIVLDHLRRFSPTINLGPSILEFLSYLILFPKLYENFSQDEYKFIFSIALPYTNPFRFSDYITCLAFRVIAMWYLNCRPSLRCAFVEQVKKSLLSNVIQPFKENNVPPQPALHSQTSSPIIAQTPPITYSCPATMSPVDQRKRSSSLNAENCFRNQHGILGGHIDHKSSLQVNEELIETFADLLSRYTHGQFLAIAPKDRCTEMLIDRSTSQTWLNGNSLVTITAGRSNNGWAEIMVRQPTGNMSWIGRLQNTVSALPMFNQQVYTDSLNFGNDIISLFSSLSLTSDDGGEVSDSLATLSSAISSISSTLSCYTPSSGAQQTADSSNANSSGQLKLRDPVPLPKDKKFDIALSNFDLITPYETHKVGVIYVGKNQAHDRAAILSNKFGSPRYHEFLGQIGTCIILNDIDPEIYFIGGLDVKGDDGKYAYFWKDNVTQVIFHVATFMLARDNDPQCNNKNRHIGNDHVCLAYNDSDEKFKLATIKGTGQLLKACVIITPMDEDTNLVEVELLPDLRNIIGDIEPRVLSNLGASLYARQMAIHLNLASKIFERRHCEGLFSKEPYVSNWVERLRCIKRIRHRLDEHRRSASNNGSLSNRGSNTLR